MKRKPKIGQRQSLIATSASLSISLGVVSGLLLSLALPAIPPALAVALDKNHQLKIARKVDIKQDPTSAEKPDAPLTEDERVNIRVYKAANRAVVNISPVASAEETLINPTNPGSNSFGSGSIISTDGYILTNNHVVDGFKNVRVTIWDGTNLHGTVVGVDPQTDLAVIKVEPPKGTKLTVLPLGDSAQMEVGRKVLAIGNPFGYDRTLTDGIVSSVGRVINTAQGRAIKGIIQTDAAINPGNSGGPLLDSQGKIIGINTAIKTMSGQSAGIGFAIPINIAKNIIPQLIDHHHVQRPEIGVDVVVFSDKGLKVLKVAKGSAAEAAGIQALRFLQFNLGNGMMLNQQDWGYSDLILEVDGQPVHSIDGFFSYIESKKPDQVVTLTILRAGKKIKIPVKLTTGTST
jgi:S1-C subfamily serine protease